jgi:hypothetical protein
MSPHDETPGVLAGVLGEDAETIQDAGDRARALVQSFNEWSVFERSSPAQRYCDFRLNVLVDFVVFIGKDTHVELRAMCARMPADRGCSTPRAQHDCAVRALDRREPNEVCQAWSSRVVVDAYRLSVGAPKYFPCASRVGVQLRNESPDIWSGPLYVSERNACLKVALPFPQWEADAIDAPSLLADLRTNGVIQGESQIYKCASDKGAQRAIECLRIRDEYGRERLDNPFGIHVTLDDHTARVTFEERPDCRIDVADVLLGPINWDERLFRHGKPLLDRNDRPC